MFSNAPIRQNAGYATEYCSEICIVHLARYNSDKNFAAFVGHFNAKELSTSGGLRHPDPLTRGSAPGPAGALPLEPVIY